MYKNWENRVGVLTLCVIENKLFWLKQCSLYSN